VSYMLTMTAHRLAMQASKLMATGGKIAIPLYSSISTRAHRPVSFLGEEEKNAQLEYGIKSPTRTVSEATFLPTLLTECIHSCTTTLAQT
jgi:hypothetical protein